MPKTVRAAFEEHKIVPSEEAVKLISEQAAQKIMLDATELFETPSWNDIFEQAEHLVCSKNDISVADRFSEKLDAISGELQHSLTKSCKHHVEKIGDAAQELSRMKTGGSRIAIG